MSPELTKVVSEQHSFPRVSGDEPPIGLAVVAIGAFSPRERG